MGGTWTGAGLGLTLLASCGVVGIEPSHRDGGTRADAPLADAASEDRTCPGPAVGVGADLALVGASAASGSCGGDLAPELVVALDVPAGASLVVAADGPSTDEDTTVYVRADCADAATELGCDRDSGVGPGAQLVLQPAAGRYYAFFDGEVASTGFTLDAAWQVELPLGAACDGVPAYWRCGRDSVCLGGSCQPACTVGTPLGGQTTYDLTDGTIGAPNLHAGTCGEGSDGGRRAGERVYALDLPAAVQNVHVSTNDPITDFDTLVYLRDGCPGTEVACNDDAAGVVASEFDTGPLPAGNYYIVVDGFSDRAGTYRLTVSITP